MTVPAHFPHHLGLIVAASLGLSGCAGVERNWPFPIVHVEDDAAVCRLLAERAQGPRSLYAVLSMAFELPQHSGVAEAVVRYEAPGRLRFIAFKDLLVTSRDIFDLVLLPDHFELRFEGDKGPERFSGRASELGQAQPGFRAFGILREALFLPGRLAANVLPRVLREPERMVVRGRSESGHELEWEIDPATLGVRRGRARLGQATIEVEYLSYRRVADAYFPEAFELRDAEHSVLVTGRLEELELDPTWTGADFEFEAEPGAN